ncbi:hypothetical protein GGR57DRAFT_28101 [Xylariaceae sp. FL1272]|nr:hypothetical protein GGR57DRAFT_28101 [Xylariaceae sp. FL1272]
MSIPIGLVVYLQGLLTADAPRSLFSCFLKVYLCISQSRQRRKRCGSYLSRAARTSMTLSRERETNIREPINFGPVRPMLQFMSSHIDHNISYFG